jgi:hypothetical protein
MTGALIHYFPQSVRSTCGYVSSFPEN